MTKETFLSIIEDYKQFNDIVLNFEKGLENLCGQDTTVMLTQFCDNPRNILHTILTKELGASENCWEWFDEVFYDLTRGSNLRCEEHIEGNCYKQFIIGSFSDFYDYLMGTLPYKVIETDEPRIATCKMNIEDIFKFGVQK